LIGGRLKAVGNRLTPSFVMIMQVNIAGGWNVGNASTFNLQPYYLTGEVL
jgi:hypothetical protein